MWRLVDRVGNSRPPWWTVLQMLSKFAGGGEVSGRCRDLRLSRVILRGRAKHGVCDAGMQSVRQANSGTCTPGFDPIFRPWATFFFARTQGRRNTAPRSGALEKSRPCLRAKGVHIRVGAATEVLHGKNQSCRASREEQECTSASACLTHLPTLSQK